MKDTILRLEEMNEKNPMVIKEPLAKVEEKWDCESILSTYTNTDNHPGLIKEIIRPWKFPMPKIDLTTKSTRDGGGFVEEEIEEEDEVEDEVDVDSLTPRSKKKYLRKLNKKKVKAEKKDWRV
jgi:protein LTV1